MLRLLWCRKALHLLAACRMWQESMASHTVISHSAFVPHGSSG